MKRMIATVAMATALTAGFAGTAGADGPPARSGAGKPAGISCQQAGIGTLQQLGLLPTVAGQGIGVVGVGVVPFRDVLSLHRRNPELFQTGGVSVVVPGVGTVPATWCNGV